MKKNQSTTFQIIKCQIHLELYLFHNQTEHITEKQVDETKNKKILFRFLILKNILLMIIVFNNDRFILYFFVVNETISVFSETHLRQAVKLFVGGGKSPIKRTHFLIL